MSGSQPNSPPVAGPQQQISNAQRKAFNQLLQNKMKVFSAETKETFESWKQEDKPGDWESVKVFGYENMKQEVIEGDFTIAAEYEEFRRVKQMAVTRSPQIKTILDKICDVGIDIIIKDAQWTVRKNGMAACEEIDVETRRGSPMKALAGQKMAELTDKHREETNRLVLVKAITNYLTGKTNSIAPEIVANAKAWWGIALDDPKVTAEIAGRVVPDSFEFNTTATEAIDNEIFTQKMDANEMLNEREMRYGIATFDGSMSALFGSGVNDVKPDNPMFLGKFDNIYVGGQTVTELCAAQTENMSPVAKSNYMKCFVTAESMKRELAMHIVLPGIGADGKPQVRPLISKVEEAIKPTFFQRVAAFFGYPQTTQQKYEKTMSNKQQNSILKEQIQNEVSERIERAASAAAEQNASNTVRQEINANALLGQTTPAPVRENSTSTANSEMYKKVPYAGMFSRAMFDPSKPTGKPSERMNEQLLVFLRNFPDGRGVALLEAMDKLHEELTKPQAVNRGNIHQINADLANAYKDAFGAAESIFEHQKQMKKDALNERRPKEPDFNNGDDGEEYNPFGGYLSDEEIMANEKYNREAEIFEQNKEKYEKEIKEQFKPSDILLAALSEQMIKMTANRAFIHVTVQDMFDEITSGKVDEFPAKSFDEHMNERTMDVLTAGKTADHGAINEVYRASIGVDELFVKPGRRLVNSDNENLQLEYLGLGDAKTDESAFRDQGAQIVGKLLGVDVVVKSRLAQDNKAGVVSAMNAAPGLRGDQYMAVKSANEAADVRTRLGEMQRKIEEANLEKKYTLPKAVVDMSNKSLQVSAIEIGVLDYIIDNDDRHVGNLFIKEEAGNFKIIGIDNDGAFGARKCILDDAEMTNLIPFVTRDLKTKIENLDATDVANALTGVVDRGERGGEVIDALKDRITKLKEHIKNIPVKTMDELNADTLNQLIDKGNSHRANKPLAWLQAYASPEAEPVINTDKLGNEIRDKNLNRKEKLINWDHENIMNERARNKNKKV
ncbi:MAG: phosphatidylinositol 4-kinase [Oscillospiraceae bacterium]|nr:phosphatidylinositol 4-kinase [Oscillospiraceae bacterium]